MLAAANAVTDADLVAGTTLRAPQVTTTANDASTFKPYDPNAILGPTTPSLPYIAPPPKQQCNAVAQILMVVVAIIVTVYTAGALTSAMVGAVPGATAAGGAMAVGGAALTGGVVGATAGASLTLSTVGSMLVGAAAGAAGAAASMAVGSVMGVASFSWRGVAAQGLAAGLTAGFGAAARAGTFGRTLQTSNYARAAAGAVAGNLANYSANRLVGNEAHFSWASVAASAVSAVITAKVVPTLADKLEINRLTENGQTQLDLLGGMVGGVVSASVRKAFVGGDVDYGQVALDAFGNMLGNRLSGQHGNWASQTQLDMGSIARVGVGISFAGGPHYPEMRSFGGPSPSFDDDVPYSMEGPITDIDRVTVFGTRDNPTSGGAWMWNSQADKWLNMDSGQLYSPSTRQQEVVQGWSPVPKVVSSNGGGYSLVDFFGGQGNFAKATANTWGIDRATRDLRAPATSPVDPATGRPYPQMRAYDPARAGQSMQQLADKIDTLRSNAFVGGTYAVARGVGVDDARAMQLGTVVAGATEAVLAFGGLKMARSMGGGSPVVANTTYGTSLADEISALRRIGAQRHVSLSDGGIVPLGQRFRFNEHIFQAELNGNKVVGFHFEPGATSSRIVSGTRTAPDSFGVYSAKIEFEASPGNWLQKKGGSTFFPDTWSRTDVMYESIQAFRTRSYPDPFKPSLWSGTTPSGVLVRGYDYPNLTIYPVKRP